MSNSDISKVFEQNLGSLKQDEDFDLHITEKALALSQPNFSWRLGKESQTSSPMFRHMAAIYTLYIYQYVYWCKFNKITCGTHLLDRHSGSALGDCEQGHFLFRLFLSASPKSAPKKIIDRQFDQICDKGTFQFHCRSFWAYYCALETKTTKYVMDINKKIYKMYQQEKAQWKSQI
jgi:hypothetical protein